MDPIATATAASVEVASKSAEQQRALVLAMLKLIETSAAVGRDVLPPDATFHTYT